MAFRPDLVIDAEPSAGPSTPAFIARRLWFTLVAATLLLAAPGLGHAESDSSSPDSATIDLAKAVGLALQANPELQAAVSDIGVASAQREKAAAARWPTLRAQTGLTEYRREQRLYPAAVPGEPATISHQIIGADLLVAFPLYTGGRISGTLDAAELAEQAARSTSQWTKTELVYRVTVAYFGILAQRRVISALDSTEAAMLQHLERLGALVEERKAAPLDRQRVEVRLAALRQRRIQEQTTLEVQTLTLLALIGNASRPPPRVTGELSAPPEQGPKAVEVLLQEALAQRADCRAMRDAVHSQERRVEVAVAGHYPQLQLAGSYGLRWGVFPSVQPEGVSAIADVGQVGLYLDVPIFEGGRVSAEVREQQARLSAMQERLRQVELRVALEVEAAVLDRRAALERVALSQATVGQASEAFRVETEKQAVGKSTISDVLSAQSDLLDAEASRARALADANIATAALRRALGEDT